METTPAVQEGKRASSKDSTAKVLAKLRRSRPKSEDAPLGQVDFSRSTEEILSTTKYSLRTRIKSFDDATRGFPFGRVSEVYGLDGCGKTALAMWACGMAKDGEIWERLTADTFDTDGKIIEHGKWGKLDPSTYEVTILYIDNENSLEEGSRMMVDGKEVDCIIAQCDTVDSMFKTIETTTDLLSEIEAECEKAHLESVKENKKSKGATPIVPLVKQFLVVVGDTIAGTSSQQEIKQAWGTQDYSRQPQQLRQGFRSLVRRLNERNVCAIFTNQVSDSFAQKPRGQKNRSPLPQDGDFVTFGGKAVRYYASLRVFMVKTLSPYKIHGGRFPDGFQIHFHVAKNRQLPPLRAGRMVLLFDRGYSPEYSMLEHFVFMRFFTVGTKGDILINFQKYGIEDVAPAEGSLQDQDDEDSPGKKHVITRAEWPEFLKTHQAQLDKLWELLVKKMFSTGPSEDSTDDVDDIDGDAPED